MKKLLSVLLAVLMLFSAVAMSASAADAVSDPITALSVKNDTLGYKSSVVICFNFAGGSSETTVPVYTIPGGFSYETVSGKYYWLPQNATQLVVGQSVSLPYAKHSDENYVFEGWYKADGSTVGTVGPYTIDLKDVDTLSGCIEFTARYRSANTEDTMGKIIGILCKIFGAIIGLLFYNGNTEAGVQLMEQVLGGVLG